MTFLPMYYASHTLLTLFLLHSFVIILLCILRYPTYLFMVRPLGLLLCFHLCYLYVFYPIHLY